MSNDSISRCELFNKLATIPSPPEANEFKAEIYKVIQGMETERVNEWIPCSERLPELTMHVIEPALGDWDNSEPVLVLHKDKKFECKWMVAQFTDGFADVYGHVEYGWVEANGFEEVENVIAWMPIPDSSEQE